MYQRTRHRYQDSPVPARIAPDPSGVRTVPPVRWWQNWTFDDPPMPVILPEELADDVRPLLAEGDRIEAVRLVRQRTGLGIRPAVLAVDALGGRGTGPDGPAPRVSG